MIKTYTSLHNHSEYSSAVLRFADAICNIPKCVNWCYENGLRGYAISDHQTVSGYVELEKAYNALDKQHPFQHIFANEFYLLSEEEDNLRFSENDRPYYWHYLVIVLDEIGLKQMYELSARAWLRSYTYKGQLRRPSFYSDFEEVVGEDKGHLAVSTACFTKGHLVKTKEGYKPIETITSKDFVLSSDGDYHKVISPTSRQYFGNGNKITFEKALKEITCTDTHKFLVNCNGNLLWKEAKDLQKNDKCLEPIVSREFNNKKEYDISFVVSELIEKENYNYSHSRNHHIKTHITLTPKFMRMLGNWIADGHCSYNIEQGNYSVGFTVNLPEYEQYSKWIFEGMRALCDFEPWIGFRYDSNRVDISYNSRELAYLFKHWFGKTDAINKHIPKFLTNISKEFNAELLYGYLLGDGYFRYRPRYGGEIVCASISQTLTTEIAELFLEQGFSPSYKTIPEFTDKHGTHHCESYYLSVSCKSMPTVINKSIELSHAELIENLSRYAFDSQKFTKIDCQWYAIKKVKRNIPCELKETVYCLNVETTHNFICQGVIAHNCIGGFLPKCILTGNTTKAKEFIQWNWRVFGKDNFYLECQPCWEDNEEQIKVNQVLWKLHKQLDIPIIVTTDSHFMRPEDRKIHTAFLKSKDGGDSREPEKFYQTTYLFTPQELREQMYVSGFDDDMIDVLFDTTNQIADKIQPITIKKTTRVPALPKIPEFEIKHYYKDYYNKFPFIKYYATEGTLNERYYYYQVEKGLHEYNIIHPVNIEEYLAQINIEMEQVKGLGEAFKGECMADYFTVVQKVVDLIWTEGDSYVGIGRGSAGCYLTNKLLNITGIDPMLPETKEFYPWWRFCSIARSESIFDCDIDIQSFKKERIIQAIKNYFGWRRVCQCVTWGRLSAKTALERAATGLGIPADTVGYIKSLIPTVRGSIYSLKDCLYGNEKKGREPVPEFIAEVKKYDDLLDIALAFEGMIVSSGVHAGALNVLQGDFTETGSYMVSSNGAVCSQFNLHDAEFAGDLKFDLLSIDCLQTIRTCMELLLKNGKIEDKGSLRDTYNYYLSYDKLDKATKEMWDLLPTMASAFQYDSKAGKEALRKIGAQNLTELTLANGLMRLAVADGEQPMDMYVRYRENINEWYQDMTNYGIPQEEQEILKELLGNYCGLMIAQSTMMSVLMDERVCNFNLKESDKARKAVAKKNAEALAETEERLYRKGAECGRTKAFLDYLWNVQIEMSKSYAFDFSHSHEYSTECLQELNLYHKFPKIYWNAAVVITQAGVEDERDNVANTTDYGKIAGSVYKAKENGIVVAPPPANHADMSFDVDEANNTILFGLGGISSINAEIAQQIISNRPYTSFRDFYARNTYQGTLITPSKFIQLIKAGCFDEFCPDRMRVMQAYFTFSTPRKQTLTTANLSELQRIGMKLPNTLTAPLAFKKYVCSKQFLYGNHPKFKSKKIYWLDERALNFFDVMCRSQLEENVDWWYDEEGRTLVVDKSLDKLFKHITDDLKAYINTPEFLKQYNTQAIKARMQEKLPNMNVNHWSFEALSYYSNEHELACIDADRYNVTTFDQLPTEPEFVTKKYGKREWRQYQLSRIMGTVIARNDAHSTITVLDSNNNVVQARFDNHSYPFYKQQLSEQHADGTKTVMDTSWFTRGQGLVLTGYRSEDTFRVKSYKNSIFPHKLQKILTINEEDGTMELQSYRYGYEPKEE